MRSLPIIHIQRLSLALCIYILVPNRKQILRMIHLPVHRGRLPGHLDSSMPDPSADLPSLSATRPTTSNSPKLALNGDHDASTPYLSFLDAHLRPTPKSLTPKSREAAVRAAKKEIAGKVREDWTWPPTSPHMQPQLDMTDPTTEWRERDSDSEYSPPSPLANADPYRFDNPDAVAQPLLSKKRKRQQRVEEEMGWNAGLRTFVERRDVWAGAKIQPSPHATNGTSPPTPPHQQPRTTLPLAPPLLPATNPIHASITPETYPSIYDKIIIRGQAPSVPINLLDVVNALVAGWKKDGEWPPKSEAESVGLGAGEVGTRRLARRSVGRVKRVLGMGRGRGVDDAGRGNGVSEE